MWMKFLCLTNRVTFDKTAIFQIYLNTVDRAIIRSKFNGLFGIFQLISKIKTFQLSFCAIWYLCEAQDKNNIYYNKNDLESNVYYIWICYIPIKFSLWIWISSHGVNFISLLLENFWTWDESPFIVKKTVFMY